ncbi:MAG: TonB-dependent receptor plug domain-containing protein [Alphaproteobacteria bacterium]|nr:TonB-dependent receptor plug domain-containing protein [Alphaproteobacteria bacterium]
MNPATTRFATLMGSVSLFTLANVLAAHAQQDAQAVQVTPQQFAQAQLAQNVAQAQTAQATPEAVPEQVLVTGSLIHGTAAVGVPVTNLGVQDFTQTGAVTVGDLFRTVPAANVAIGPSATNSGGHQERETRVNLRDLDATGPRSLLMVDGVRFPPQADGLCAIDPSIIPALALDRVDILADGASATYGSDAIAGVINIILKRGFDGATTLLHTEMPTDGGGVQYQASQLWGRTWDGGDITLTYEWNDEGHVKGSTHSKYTTNFLPWGLEDPYVPIGASIPGTISAANASSAGAADPNAPNVVTSISAGVTPVPMLVNAVCSNCYAIPRGTGANFSPGAGGFGPQLPGSAATLNWASLKPTTGTNFVDPLSGTGGWELAAQQRNSFVATLDQRLFPGVSFFFSGFYTNRRVEEHLPSFGGQGLGAYTQTLTVPTTNPYYPTGAPPGLEVSYDFAKEAPPFAPAWEISERYQFGFNLDLPFGWNGQVYDSRSYEDVGYLSHVVSSNAINQALGNTPGLPPNIPYLNVFCDPNAFQCNSPATLNYIRAERTQGAHYTIDEKAARFDGPIPFDLPAGQIKAAIGGLYDADNVNGWGGFTTGAVGNPPINQAITYDQEPYHIWAGFAQLDLPVFGDNFNLPLVRKLDIEGSFRYDSYGGNINATGNTSNPKVAFTWLVDETAGLTFRGSWGSSFRFANEGEFSEVLSPVDQSVNLVGSSQSDTILCTGGAPTPGSAAADLHAAGFACGSTPGGISYGGAPLAVLRTFTNAATGQFQTREGGVSLAPERALNYSVGFEIAPQFDFLRGLDIQATWYSIKINGVLGGFLGEGDEVSLASPIQRFHFIVPSDLGCPVADNAKPTLCAPFEIMARAALNDPNTDSNIGQLTNVYWLNDSGTFGSGFIHAEGVDWNGSYDFDTGDFGAWNVGAVGTYYLHRFDQTVSGGPIFDDYHQDFASLAGVGNNGVETLPRLKYRARVGWSNGPYTATLFYNFQSHFFETRVVAPPNVNFQCTTSGGTLGGGTFPCAINNFTSSSFEPDWNTFDLSLGYNTGDMPENDYLKRITIQLTINNIMGIHSPFEYGPTSVTRNPSAFDITRSDLGRVVGLTLVKNW